MIWIIEDKMPHVGLLTNGELRKSEIIKAYKELTTAYGGIRDFVAILDGIFEGVYSLSAVMCAGTIITESLDGYLTKGSWFEKAMYIRINECDIVFSPMSVQILFDEELDEYEFDGNNGVRYKFNKNRKAEIQKRGGI